RSMSQASASAGVGPSLEPYDTSPKLLLRNAEIRGAKTAFREKDYGIWQSYSWAEIADEVRAFACGLAARGLKRDDKFAIVGGNRPQLYWAFDAVQAIGAVPVPLYADSVAEEMVYVLEHAEARFAVCENQEQVDKLLSLKDRLPTLELMIYHWPKGMRHYTHPFLAALKTLQEEGRAFDAANPEFFAAEVA